MDQEQFDCEKDFIIQEFELGHITYQDMKALLSDLYLNNNVIVLQPL